MATTKARGWWNRPCRAAKERCPDGITPLTRCVERKLVAHLDGAMRTPRFAGPAVALGVKADVSAARSPPTHAAPLSQRVVRSAGAPLDSQTRAAMEQRFGHDFGRVRVHTDAGAASSAALLGARAWALGRHVVFGSGEYAPRTADGSRLLAHELTHVLQQGAQDPSAGRVVLGRATDPAEHTAEEIARSDVDPPRAGETPTSPALRIRDRLSSAGAERGVLRRVASWGGDYTTDKYDVVKTGGVEDGVDIVLRFAPNKRVDAEMIGMVQMVTTKDKGKVVAASATVGTRSIAAGTAGEGAHIDRLSAAGTNYGNPLYATGAPAAGDVLSATATVAGWGQHGWRFTDKAGKLRKQDALLKDTPRIPGHGADASQIFETTALAVAGTQEGTYYGSVQWGWQTDAAGTFSKLPLTLVSNDVPSATFATSSELWNKSKTAAGKETIDLPLVAGKYTNATGVWIVSNPATAATSIVAKVKKNTRVEVTDKGAAQPFNTGAKVQWWKVTVVDGTAIGKVGWAMETMLSDTKT
jgi:hypothetical protein